MYKKTIWEAWNWLLSFFNDPTPEEQDEAARSVIRAELHGLYERIKVLEKLLGEPERLRNRRIAIQLAEEMQRKLHEKRRNPQPLTPEEEFLKKAWQESLTPRSECKHLKGGAASRWGVDIYGDRRRGPIKDYNIMCHTFPDGVTKAWCGYNCGFVSFKGDANWQKAIEMMGQSTNTPSSSERFASSK